MNQLAALLAVLAGPEVQGEMDRDAIRDVVRAHIAEIRQCYNQGLAEDPKLAGRLAVHFEIGRTGRVTSAQLQSSDLGHAGVESCVVGAVKDWKFPRPRGGGKVSVTYPFVLSPG